MFLILVSFVRELLQAERELETTTQDQAYIKGIVRNSAR